MSDSLACVPQEILEHIAFFVATSTFLGPPKGILPLLLANHTIHSHLAPSSNPHLYARIFVTKFDVGHAARRLGPDALSSGALSDELQRRCTCLTRIRRRSDSKVPRDPLFVYDEGPLRSLLWTAYLMMLENDGNNLEQLRSYAGMDQWLKEYWFDPSGSSLATLSVRMDAWPPGNMQNTLAMWLFWFLLRPDTFERNTPTCRNAVTILKLVALGAHKYELASPSWTKFLPTGNGFETTPTILYSKSKNLIPPPMSAPAILSFLALTDKLPGLDTSSSMTSPLRRQCHEWESEWDRCRNLGTSEFGNILTGSFIPGSIQGVWDGIFTYTEFTAYAALLAGAPPAILHRGLVAQHSQTWKLREYHFTTASAAHPHNHSNGPSASPLGGGDALKAYFPDGTQIFDRASAIEVLEPGRPESIFYNRAEIVDVASTVASDGEVSLDHQVKDVIIIGEGHSAWGEFNLLGRVRPCDGFVSLCKTYTDGDRGKWLYRSFLVGNAQGSLSGRWRDVLSPQSVPGYEGCFAMSHRR
ncbi:hypothetical protein FIBSPDRAFT_847884 [Athelia psychrophila]|uniref:Uncharacterized protein n=1 Tax=Athelia psychrophila TaxID=1759441 RepID=A0A166W0V4_9AGAM|nr:hypothetical protein FIBSPDRAFT_847884 [Fibularhizoctonia sp. CBS 109695]